jgi:hypothetical protein
VALNISVRSSDIASSASSSVTVVVMTDLETAAYQERS